MTLALLYDTNWISYQQVAFIAMRLEHWSCKPGVVSSILTGGRPKHFYIIQATQLLLLAPNKYHYCIYIFWAYSVGL